VIIDSLFERVGFLPKYYHEIYSIVKVLKLRAAFFLPFSPAGLNIMDTYYFQLYHEVKLYFCHRLPVAYLTSIDEFTSHVIITHNVVLY